MSTVEVRGLEKSFGRVLVLDRVDLHVGSGELVAVLGPSGCGKTTLLRVVAGFERADAGTVVVDGRTLAGPGAHVPPHRRRIAVVPQEGALFPHLTVADNVGFGLGRGERAGSRVADLLAMAGLSGLGDRMPHQISGGQQQRVAIARALAPAPAVVLLDEPFSGLDAALRAGLRQEVKDLLRAAGSTAVLVTHDQEEALSLADSVAVMRDGRIVQQGAPDDVYRFPADLGVAAFLGDANVLDGAVEGGTVTCSLGTLELVGAIAPGPARVLVRPEQVVLGGHLRAVVAERRYFGHDTMLVLHLPDGERLLARTPSGAPAPGSEVTVAVAGRVVCYPRQP